MSKKKKYLGRDISRVGGLLGLAVIVASCAAGPYATTNRVYRRQAKALVRPLWALPTVPDSLATAAYQVGTTNFNLRKPNYVIIHHTAQHSTAQTLEFISDAAAAGANSVLVLPNGT